MAKSRHGKNAGCFEAVDSREEAIFGPVAELMPGKSEQELLALSGRIEIHSEGRAACTSHCRAA